MRTILFLIITNILNLSFSYAQGVKSVLDKETNPGEVLVEFDNRSNEVKGTYYIDEEWNKGDILLKSGAEIKSQWVRYDLKSDMLEVKLIDEIKVVPLRKLALFQLINNQVNQLYSNCDRYSFDNETVFSGICQVLDSGRYGAVVKYDYHIKKADYVPALDMGSRDDEIIVNKHVFLARRNHIYKMPKRKKDFYDFFVNPSTDIKSYIKNNNLNFRKEEDLVRIISYLNDNINN